MCLLILTIYRTKILLYFASNNCRFLYISSLNVILFIMWLGHFIRNLLLFYYGYAAPSQALKGSLEHRRAPCGVWVHQKGCPLAASGHLPWLSNCCIWSSLCDHLERT